MPATQQLEKLTIEELARAQRLARDLANAGVCEPHELRQLWDLCDRLDAAVAAKRKAGPEAPVSS